MILTVYEDETDPDTRLAWPLGGVLRDFTGWTLSVEVVDRQTNTVVLNKTTGVSGGNGTGLSNVNIAWTAAEKAALAGDVWKIRPIAVNGIERAVFELDDKGTLLGFHVIAKPT